MRIVISTKTGLIVEPEHLKGKKLYWNDSSVEAPGAVFEINEGEIPEPPEIVYTDD